MVNKKIKNKVIKNIRSKNKGVKVNKVIKKEDVKKPKEIYNEIKKVLRISKLSTDKKIEVLQAISLEVMGFNMVENLNKQQPKSL
jgi:predicted Zn-ribbon and HTH transcriptional regulator